MNNNIILLDLKAVLFLLLNDSKKKYTGKGSEEICLRRQLVSVLRTFPPGKLLGENIQGGNCPG